MVRSPFRLVRVDSIRCLQIRGGGGGARTKMKKCSRWATIFLKCSVKRGWVKTYFDGLFIDMDGCIHTGDINTIVFNIYHVVGSNQYE